MQHDPQAPGRAAHGRLAKAVTDLAAHVKTALTGLQNKIDQGHAAADLTPDIEALKAEVAAKAEAATADVPPAETTT